MADGLDGAGWVLYGSVATFGQVELNASGSTQSREWRRWPESLKGW